MDRFGLMSESHVRGNAGNHQGMRATWRKLSEKSGKRLSRVSATISRSLRGVHGLKVQLMFLGLNGILQPIVSPPDFGGFLSIVCLIGGVCQIHCRCLSSTIA